MGIYVGKLTPVIVVFRVTNIKETTTQKYSHTHKNHTIHYTYRHPFPWTQTYTINHSAASSWNRSNQPYYCIYKLLSMTSPYAHSQQEFEINLPSTLKNQRESLNFLIYKAFPHQVKDFRIHIAFTCRKGQHKYRRENTMRIKSHGGIVFGSFGDSRKPDESSVESREPSKIRAHTLRMKGKTFAWVMNPKSIWVEIVNSFSWGQIAAGERTLYLTEYSRC